MKTTIVDLLKQPDNTAQYQHAYRLLINVLCKNMWSRKSKYGLIERGTGVTMSYHKISIAAILRAIKYAPENKNGICGQRLLMRWLSPENYKLMKDAMCEWPKCSNCRVYPVPTRTDVPSAALAQIAYMRERENNRSLWDASTEYGRLRWELLDWLIKHPDMQRPLWSRT